MWKSQLLSVACLSAIPELNANSVAFSTYTSPRYTLTPYSEVIRVGQRGESTIEVANTFVQNFVTVCATFDILIITW